MKKELYPSNSHYPQYPSQIKGQVHFRQEFVGDFFFWEGLPQGTLQNGLVFHVLYNTVHRGFHICFQQHKFFTGLPCRCPSGPIPLPEGVDKLLLQSYSSVQRGAGNQVVRFSHHTGPFSFISVKWEKKFSQPDRPHCDSLNYCKVKRKGSMDTNIHLKSYNCRWEILSEGNMITTYSTSQLLSINNFHPPPPSKTSRRSDTKLHRQRTAH